jgi:hypothetical protein
MTDSPSTVSMRPSAIRKLAVAAAVAVVLVVISLSLAAHRGSRVPPGTHAASADTIGSYRTTMPSPSPADDGIANSNQIGSEMVKGYVPTSPYLPADPGTANSNQVGSEMIGDYVPTTAPPGPRSGPGFGAGEP